MRAVRTLALAALLAGAMCVQGKEELVWKNLFAPPYATNPEIALTIDCLSKDLCFIPGGSNGRGFAMYKFDGKVSGEMIPMQEPNMTMMVMTTAIGGTTAMPKGAFGGPGMFSASHALQYLSNGTEWLDSAMPPEFIWVTQSMSGTADGEHIISVGQGPFTGNSIMHSTDAGKTFTNKKLTIPPLVKDCTFPGYVEMIDDQTWYMTLGGQPEQNNNNNNNGMKTHPSAKKGQLKKQQLRAHAKATGQESILAAMEAEAARNQPQCGYSGQVAKTTDGGATWSIQFNTTSYTLSEMDCVSATHCVVVGWGLTPDNATINVLLQTTDGQTWTETFHEVGTPLAINAVAFADSQEVWVAGGYDTQQTRAGAFMVSKDGGATWKQSSRLIPDLEMIMDVSFSPDGVGFAVAMSEFRTSTVLRYEKQEYYGYFTQAHCPLGTCKFLCQNVSFPQGFCLEVEGGSAKAYCTATSVEQHVYDTTSCIGSFKVMSMPINQCLNGTQGQKFENFCNTSVGSMKSEKTVPQTTGFWGLF